MWVLANFYCGCRWNKERTSSIYLYIALFVPTLAWFFRPGFEQPVLFKNIPAFLWGVQPDGLYTTLQPKAFADCMILLKQKGLNRRQDPNCLPIAAASWVSAILPEEEGADCFPEEQSRLHLETKEAYSMAVNTAFPIPCFSPLSILLDQKCLPKLIPKSNKRPVKNATSFEQIFL